MRRYGRQDVNHGAVKALFEAHGCHVHDGKDYGGGFPDLMVGWRDRIALVEVKQPKGKLTPTQEAFHAIWPVFVARDDQSVQEICQWLKR